MKKVNFLKQIVRNYALFLIGLFIASMGVALSTKAGLGTSPVASVPYSISLINHTLTFGWWLNLWSVIQIVVQIALLRKKFTGKRYENIKIFFDVLYIVAAAIISFLFLGKLEGVREGSIIAALLVGNIIKIYNCLFEKLTKKAS